MTTNTELSDSTGHLSKAEGTVRSNRTVEAAHGTRPISIVPSKQTDAVVYLVHNTSIRKVMTDGKCFYSLVDFMGEFAESDQNARQYWNDVKKAMVNRYGFEVSENIRRFKLPAKDGKLRLTDCGNIITIRRVIMSIPSPKAEPLRMWLAGKDDALLVYRELNILNGSEWAADTIHLEMAQLDPVGDEPAFAEMGYGRSQRSQGRK